ncbi:MAG: ComEC/Rec2 family competence protein [bacterium]|nr:ComEC/Rec2 family competence protein [bacterium]
MKITKKKISYLAGILFLLNIFTWQEVFYLSRANNLKIHFLDVGQGDAIFIETPQSHQILIDGGPDSTVIEKLKSLIPSQDKIIDLVILTHPEKDHMQGLIDVLQRYKVDYILWTGILRQTPEYQKWIEVLNEEQKQGAKIITGYAQKTVKAGNASIDILYPFEDLSGKELKDSNDSSIVSRLVFGENEFLFTGDITNKTEEYLLNNKYNLQSDVLKVSHHGSKYSTSDYFLENVNPEIAVISVGKENSYGHPTPEVLQRLEKFGIKVLRTDLDGDIEIMSDGEIIQIK